MKISNNRWQTFFSELKRRKVVQVVIAYVAFAWLMIQVGDVLVDTFETPSWFLKALFLILIIGLPVTAILAWIFDIKQGGIVKTKELPHPNSLDIKSIPIIFHATFPNSVPIEKGTERIKDYVVWSGDYRAQRHDVFDNECLILFENSIDALRYAIKIQNHSLSLDLPLKISVIEAPKDYSKNFSEAEEIVRARTLAVDAKAGAILSTKAVKEAIKNRGIESVEQAFSPIDIHRSAIEQTEYIIDPTKIQEVNQALNEYSETVLYVKTPMTLKLAALVFLSVIGGILWTFIPTLERSDNITLSILPFKNTSVDKSHENFVNGLSEDIFFNISKIPNLNITSRRSSQAMTNSDLSIQEIGKILNADWVLEGSINRINDKVRVSIWITDSESGLEQWSQIFNLYSSNLQAGNRQIIKSISEFMDTPVEVLTAIQSSDISTQEIYPLYLQAKGLLKKPPTMDRLYEVETLFKNMLTDAPNYSPAIAGLCQVYVLMYNLQFEAAFFKQAEEHCTQSYQAESSNIDVLIALAKLQIKKGNFIEAQRYIKTAQSINPTDVELINSQADLERRRGNLEQSLNFLEQALLIEPGYWKTSQSMGIIHLNSGDWDSAVSAFEKVINLVPEDSHGYINLGNAYFFQGNFSKAAIAYEESLKYHKDHTALSNIATMWFYHGDYTKATNYYLQAIQLAPNQYIYWLNLADTKDQIAEFKDEALTHYRHTLDLASTLLNISPNDADAIAISAWCYAKLGERENAQVSLDTAVELSPNNPNILFLAAKTKALIGDSVTGAKYLEQAIEFGFPESVIAASPIVQSLNIYQP